MSGTKSLSLCFLGETFTWKSVICSLKALQRREIDLVRRHPVKVAVFRVNLKRPLYTAVKNTTCCNHIAVFSKEIVLKTEQETEKLAGIIADNVTYGDAVLLYGDFGTGKTTFARAFVRKILCDPFLIVSSPSYLLMNEYQLTREAQGEVKRFVVYHLDLWRIESCENLPLLDLQNSLQRGVCIIEWPASVEKLLPDEKLVLRFSFFDEKRKVKLLMFGSKWKSLQECLSSSY